MLHNTGGSDWDADSPNAPGHVLGDMGGDTITSPFAGAQESLLNRNAVLVGGEPLGEGLQLGVQAAAEVDGAHRAEVVGEVAEELEHVAEVVGTGETKARYCSGVISL
jgi:hypothetical protein